MSNNVENILGPVPEWFDDADIDFNTSDIGETILDSPNLSTINNNVPVPGSNGSGSELRMSIGTPHKSVRAVLLYADLISNKLRDPSMKYRNLNQPTAR